MKNEDNNSNKIERILNMYVKLCEGKPLNKLEEAANYGVNDRTIQRDIDDLRAFLANRAVENPSEDYEIVYQRSKKAFVLKGHKSSLMTNSEILAVSKILLESRAFRKKDINSILDKLIAGCVPQKNMKLVSDLISNEKYHYIELSHKTSITDRLWEIAESIKNLKLLKLTYEKQVASKETVTRIVEPISIMFSEYYFYLNAYIVEKKGTEYKHNYSYPAIFRIDRIKKLTELDQKFRINYSSRFEEGEFRKKIQFMYPGKLMKCVFKYSGSNVEAVLDRLPTSKIIKEENNTFTLEAEVFGNGILMWFLSQGTSIEILRPASLRSKMKELVGKMAEVYR